MGFHDVENYSLAYEFGRIHATFMHNTIFYKQVHVTGLENMPENEAVILVGNHQNALMDALAIICTKRWQPVFLARSDIFKNPIIAKLLMILKILPVYRMKDGKEALKKNEEIFKRNVEILLQKKYLCLMPEASHQGIRKLRTIQKGVSRIAFQAEEESGFNLSLKIVPVGINFSHYTSFRSIIMINYGKPIEIKDLLEEYKTNPNSAHNQVRERIEKGISELIIDIRNDKFYDMYESLREIYDTNMMQKMGFAKTNFPNKFVADRKMIELLDNYDEQNLQEMENLNSKVTEYTQKLKTNKLRDWLFEKPKSWFLLLLQTLFIIISFPIFLYGAVNNIIIFKLPRLVTKKIKDINFHTSIEFPILQFGLPIYYLILFILAWIFTNIIWVKWAYILSLPFAGLFAFWYWVLGIKTFAKWRYYLNFNKKDIVEMRNIRNEIINKMNEIVGN